MEENNTTQESENHDRTVVPPTTQMSYPHDTNVTQSILPINTNYLEHIAHSGNARHEKGVKETQPTSQTVSPHEIEEVFNELWKIYPLKKAKERSVLALIKILASKTPDEGKSLAKEIWCGLKAHIAEHEAKKELKEQGAEIWVPELPYLSSWLNQARWHDHYQTPEEILITATRKKQTLDLSAIESQWKFN